MNETCLKCGKTGHIQKVCRSKGPASAAKGKWGRAQKFKKPNPQGANYVSQGDDETDTDKVMFTLYKLDVLDILAEEPFVETLTVNDTEVQFEVDSGCGVTVVNHSVYKTLWGKEVPALHPCRVRLRTYTGHKVNVLGAAMVKVQSKNTTKKPTSGSCAYA